MFWQMFRIERKKLFRRPVLWVEMGLLLSLVVIALLALFAVYSSAAIPAEERLEIEPIITGPAALLSMQSIASGSGTGGIALIVLAGALVAQEYSWHTMSLWLRNGTPRLLLLGAKLATLLTAATLIILSVLLVNGTLVVLFAARAGSPLDLTRIDVLQLGLSPLRTACTLLPYVAMGTLLAVKSRSTIATIGGGIALVLGESIAGQILLQFGSRLPLYLPGLLAESLMSANTGIVANGIVGSPSGLLAPGTAALFIGLYTALLLGLAAWAFQRQDLSA